MGESERPTQERAGELAGIVALGDWQEQAIAALHEEERTALRAAIEGWCAHALRGIADDLGRGGKLLGARYLPDGWEKVLLDIQGHWFRNQLLIDTLPGWLLLEDEIRARCPAIATLLVLACRDHGRGHRPAWFLSVGGLSHLLAGAQRGFGATDRAAAGVLELAASWPEWARDIETVEWRRVCMSEIPRAGVELAVTIAAETSRLRSLAVASSRASSVAGRVMRREVREESSALCEAVRAVSPNTKHGTWASWPYPEFRQSWGGAAPRRWSHDIHPAAALGIEAYQALEKMSRVRPHASLLQQAFKAEQCAGATLAMALATAGSTHSNDAGPDSRWPG